MPSSPATVVVVEDDRSVREMLCTVLADEGHHVAAHSDGETAIVDTATDRCDLLIVDLGLPGIGGLDLCRHVRRRGRTDPILILTARSDVTDRVDGLDAGADDYLVKPFALDELLARVRALIRRRDFRANPESLVLGDLSIDRDTRTARRGDEPLDLTRLEFDLLLLLVVRSPAVLRRDEIHEQIWGYDQQHMSNSLEVFVSQLRRKTELTGRPRLIHTVRGVGYTARADAAP